MNNRLRTAVLASIMFLAFALMIRADLFAQTHPYIHIVGKKETLWQISRKYNVDVKDLKKANKLRFPYFLSVGQKLVIPGMSSESAPEDAYRDIDDLCRVSVNRKVNWMYVVVHHSATYEGNAVGFDNYHRYKRHMQHGLAYHFVIDNGLGGEDGRIEVGNRWKTHWEGGHTSNPVMNKVGIGVCLVGNFERRVPTKKQLESLCRLTKYLQRKFGIPDRNVIMHRQVVQKRTQCPGKKFPVAKFKKMMDEFI